MHAIFFTLIHVYHSKFVFRTANPEANPMLLTVILNLIDFFTNLNLKMRIFSSKNIKELFLI